MPRKQDFKLSIVSLPLLKHYTSISKLILPLFRPLGAASVLLVFY